MAFNDVVKLAPGVFFRYSSISATDMTVPFGGCNNIWIVFKDYVVVIDRQLPQGGPATCWPAVKKTTTSRCATSWTRTTTATRLRQRRLGQGRAKLVGQASAPVSCAQRAETMGRGCQGPQGRGEERTERAWTSVPTPNTCWTTARSASSSLLGHATRPATPMAYRPKHQLLCTGLRLRERGLQLQGHSNRNVDHLFGKDGEFGRAASVPGVTGR